MNQKKIGNFISTLRKENNLTQEELANKLGITKNAVSKWERGISMMDISLLSPICKIFNISVTELLNGERINKDELQDKADETIKSTIDYSNKKIKKNRIKVILLTILSILVFSSIIYFSYKLYLLNKYSYPVKENYEEIIEGLTPKKELTIYKRTIEENDYLKVYNIKIRNDFKDFTLIEPDEYSSDQTIRLTKEENDKRTTIQFSNDPLSNMQDIDIFTTDVRLMVDNYEKGSLEDKFNSADRKYFLLKNDINNDIDFYDFIVKNYPLKSNIFMSKRTLMENYAFNSFFDIALPLVDSTLLIKGDYQGFVFYIGIESDVTVTQITLIRNGKRYGFLTNDPRFLDEDYLIDIIGTIEIRDN